MIYYLESREFNRCRELYEEVFEEDSKSFVDFYFNNLMQNHQVLVEEQADRIISMAQWINRKMQLQHNSLPIPYLFAVATKKEYRRQGRMGNLLNKLLFDLYQQKFPFAYLIPVAEGIYEPYGFRMGNIRKKKMWHNMEPHQEQTGAARPTLKVVKLQESNFGDYITPLLEYIQNYLEKNWDMYLNRDILYYQSLMRLLSCEGGSIFVLLEQEKIKGYGYTEQRANTALRECIVNEAYEAFFLQAICEIYNQESIEVRGNWLEVRIVDLMSMFKLLTAEKEFQLTIQITDSIISENQKTWKLIFRQWENEIKADVAATKEQWELQMDISELTEFLFGDYQIPVSIPEQVKIKMGYIHRYQKIYINEEV